MAAVLRNLENVSLISNYNLIFCGLYICLLKLACNYTSFKTLWRQHFQAT